MCNPTAGRRLINANLQPHRCELHEGQVVGRASVAARRDPARVEVIRIFDGLSVRGAWIRQEVGEQDFAVADASEAVRDAKMVLLNEIAWQFRERP
jgi:hypothetical protein